MVNRSRGRDAGRRAVALYLFDNANAKGKLYGAEVSVRDWAIIRQAISRAATR